MQSPQKQDNKKCYILHHADTSLNMLLLESGGVGYIWYDIAFEKKYLFRKLHVISQIFFIVNKGKIDLYLNVQLRSSQTI